MSVETEWDVERGLAVRKVLGELAVEDVVEAMKSSYSHPSFVSGMNSLWDLRQGNPAGLRSDDIRKIVSFATATVVERGQGYRTAVVAPDALSFGLSRMLQTMGSDLPCNIQVFKDYGEAHAWASGPEAQELPGDRAQST